MNIKISYLCLCAFFLSSHVFLHTVSYQESLQQSVYNWKKTSLAHASDEELITLATVFLFSYHIIQSSCAMIVAKFTMYQHLIKTYTPSLAHSWHENLQINQNDIVSLEQTLETMKTAQSELLHLYNYSTHIIPHIARSNPSLMNSLVTDLKHALLMWGKTEPIIKNQWNSMYELLEKCLPQIENTNQTIEKITTLFDYQSIYIKNAVLSYDQASKTLEHIITELNMYKIQSVSLLKEFFDTSFIMYYTALYEIIINQHPHITEQQISIIWPFSIIDPTLFFQQKCTFITEKPVS